MDIRHDIEKKSLPSALYMICIDSDKHSPEWARRTDGSVYAVTELKVAKRMVKILAKTSEHSFYKNSHLLIYKCDPSDETYNGVSIVYVAKIIDGDLVEENDIL